MREVAGERGQAVVRAELRDPFSINLERAFPEPDEVFARNGEDVGDVRGVIDAWRFDIEANGSRIFRVLQYDEKREILEGLSVAERQVLVVALAVLRVEVDVEKLSCLEAELDVPAT